jgi:hypothetical protein
LSGECDIKDVERAIVSLTRALAGESREGAVGPEFEKWWVVAVGDLFDVESFDQREAARERLRRLLVARGIRLPEWVWVYDEESRAKVVLAELRSSEEAERLAGIFRSKGIDVRVSRELEHETTEPSEPDTIA